MTRPRQSRYTSMITFSHYSHHNRPIRRHSPSPSCDHISTNRVALFVITWFRVNHYPIRRFPQSPDHTSRSQIYQLTTKISYYKWYGMRYYCLKVFQSRHFLQNSSMPLSVSIAQICSYKIYFFFKDTFIYHFQFSILLMFLIVRTKLRCIF